MCETCEEVQQQLLADGGGACGQIICNHQDDRTLVIEDGVEDDASTVLSTFSPTPAAVDMLPKRDSRRLRFVLNENKRLIHYEYCNATILKWIVE